MRTVGYINLRRTSRFSENRQENGSSTLSIGDVTMFHPGGENAKVLAIATPTILIYTYTVYTCICIGYV